VSYLTYRHGRRSQADNLSIDELLHGYPPTRITDLPRRLPDVPLLLRPSVDDHDSMTVVFRYMHLSSLGTVPCYVQID
jgi:hypothetical protein